MEVCSRYHAPAALLPGRTPASIEQEAVWTPEPVWTFGERRDLFAPVGVRNPDRPGSIVVGLPTTLSRRSLYTLCTWPESQYTRIVSPHTST